MNSDRVGQANCIIDNRVSTDKQLYGTGLDEQELSCEYFAKKNNFNVLAMFSKSYSGRKEEREDFKNILSEIDAYIEGGTAVHFYVIKSIDRFTRLGTTIYDLMLSELRKRQIRLIDAKGTIQDEVNLMEHLGLEYDWSVHDPSRKSQNHGG